MAAPPLRLGALVVALAALGCGDNIGDPFLALVRVSGASPFHDGCGGAQPGASYSGVEVEPQVAIDPTNAAHLVGAWQQDRWSNGGARGIGTAATFDGGASWTTATPPVGRCSGGSAPGADYQRTTDPWVAFAADGSVHLAVQVFDAITNRNAMTVSRSRDGGMTWGDPVVLLADDVPNIFNDKDALTADPADPGRLYLVWDRVTQIDPTHASGPTWLARATDGAWEPARAIYDPGDDAQTIGNLIVVLPDGTLVCAFDLITGASSTVPNHMLAVIRSVDHGLTWSGAKVIAAMRAAGAEAGEAGEAGERKGDAGERRSDPGDSAESVGAPTLRIARRAPIRTGADLPQAAVDRTSGAIYLAWEDSPAANVPDAVMLVRSTDGGVSWSAPIAVNGALDVDAFTPSVAVATDGTVGVSYFDLRAARPGADPPPTTPWLATSHDGGATWAEQAMSDAFDLGPARLDTFYFLGDYQGLAAVGTGFLAFFAAATPGDGTHTDVFVRQPR